MEIIHLHHPYDPEKIPNDDVVLAMGFFDGVHKGHQKVIQTAKEKADEKKLKLAVMTFNQYPGIVFQKVTTDEMRYLTTIEKKEALMRSLGVDILYVVSFTSALAELRPQTFVDQYMVALHAKVVVAGFDYTYGIKETANMQRLSEYAKNRFEVMTVDKCSDENGKISSTRIRAAIDSGEISKANDLLGYAYTTAGTVIHGDARGRLLGFPTANIQVNAQVRIPKLGIYAVKIKVGSEWYLGMASIGHNVTFGEGRPMTIEVYILDFKQDIYGEKVAVTWYEHLRDEVKFSGAEALVEQLKQDEQATRDYFRKNGDV